MLTLRLPPPLPSVDDGDVPLDERAREVQQVREEPGRRDLRAGARALHHHRRLGVPPREDLDHILVGLRARAIIRGGNLW